ncbi:hypothetical protein LTR84_011833 [Exophiala bonariae]|uniref:N-acetyltransferase domain-containing protein n=1 Tax=Exophiala bonariae TaxID=1690606 RepID=A0AAV9NH44_9EURO|nr:hypothetical protein LTR84_011833 [Exophiala bonariae]
MTIGTEARRPPPPFTLHTLDASSPRTSLEPVLRLSNRIFNTTASEPTHHSSLDEWCARLRQKDSILVYGSTAPDESIDPASADGMPKRGGQVQVQTQAREVVGFVFAVVKTEPALPFPTLHVWLAGVSERARGSGVFAALMSRVQHHARSKGVNGLSVATFPATFGKMYAILLKQGWEAREWKEEGKKVLMIKAI